MCFSDFSLISIFITNLKLIKEDKFLQPWNKVLEAVIAFVSAVP